MTFPATEWSINYATNDLRFLSSKQQISTINCSAIAPGSAITILARSYIAYAGEDWRLRISYRDATVAEMAVYQSDSVIISFTITAVAGIAESSSKGCRLTMNIRRPVPPSTLLLSGSVRFRASDGAASVTLNVGGRIRPHAGLRALVTDFRC